MRSEPVLWSCQQYQWWSSCGNWHNSNNNNNCLLRYTVHIWRYLSPITGPRLQQLLRVAAGQDWRKKSQERQNNTGKLIQQRKKDPDIRNYGFLSWASSVWKLRKTIDIPTRLKYFFFAIKDALRFCNRPTFNRSHFLDDRVNWSYTRSGMSIDFQQI